MYEIKVEPAFKADYARVMKRHPRLRGEFKEAVSELMRTGAVPNEYGPHELSNPGGNYNAHRLSPLGRHGRCRGALHAP